mmetsp:Transcript_16976/g.30553  ORF Transcript_16976/g.30553 Transcript_16976/m.30553 type:complete len:679 (+) Transcript_16976:3497-5533(+)
MQSKDHLNTFGRPYKLTKRAIDYPGATKPRMYDDLPIDLILSRMARPTQYSSVPKSTHLQLAGSSVVNDGFPGINSVTVARSLGPPMTKSYSQPAIRTYGDTNSSRDFTTSRAEYTGTADGDTGRLVAKFSQRTYQPSNDMTTSSTEKPQLLNLDVKYTRGMAVAAQTIVPPPPDLIKSVFKIFSFGTGQDSASFNPSKALGIGILINDILALTAHSVIPDPNFAISRYAKLSDGQTLRFDPHLCFATSAQKEFTVVAFKDFHSRTVLRFLNPITLYQPFTVSGKAPVATVPFDPHHPKELIVSEVDTFTFTAAGPDLLPGTPVFNSQWMLQGMFTKVYSNINIAVQLIPLLWHMEANLESYNSRVLYKYLHGDHCGLLEKYHRKFLYFVSWHGNTVWKYNLSTSKWSEMEILNDNEFSKENPHWTFHWNSRIVRLKSGGILIIGGRDRETSSETRDVWKLSPTKQHTLAHSSPMLHPREACAAINSEDKFVFVMGGRTNSRSVERMSLASKSWRSCASMIYARYNAAACTGMEGHYIFVFGGVLAGTSAERYNIATDQWELLSLRLPSELYHLALFPVSSRKIALIGGNQTDQIYIMNIETSVTLARGTSSYEVDVKEIYTLTRCLESLPSILETTYPVAFDATNDRLYLLNMAFTGRNKQVPQVSEIDRRVLKYLE